MASLAGRTLFITGASRGIGLAIAKRAARDGANIVLAAKTASPHATLPGTIYSAADEVEEAGGQALPIVLDIRDDSAVHKAVAMAAEHFGGIDVCINNASAINNGGTMSVAPRAFDLMHGVNARGTYVTTQACIPHLLEAPKGHAHVLTLSPPMDMDPRWFAGCGVAYTMAKYGMSMCTLGMSLEFKRKIGFNSLWPRTGIATAALKMLAGEEGLQACRKPEIMADAAHAILCKDGTKFNGNFLIDDDVVVEELGLTQEQLRQYQVTPELPPERLVPDFFVGDPVPVLKLFGVPVLEE